MSPEQIIVLLVAIIGVLIKMEMGFRKIKRNDFGEFIKRDEFEGLKKEVSGTGKTVERLDERSKEQGKQIDALFKWKNSQ